MNLAPISITEENILRTEKQLALESKNLAEGFVAQPEQVPARSFCDDTALWIASRFGGIDSALND